MASNFLQQLRADGQRIVGQLSRQQKLGLGALAAAVVMGSTFLFIWAQNPDYTPLYRGLDDKDANSIVMKLREDKVAYQLADNGATILVPRGKVDELRLTLAGLELPKHGSIGFEVFDRTSFGMTDQQQKIQYQRALQGELSRTIGTVSGVGSARVHLVIPTPDLFSDGDAQKQATATIVLKLTDGHKLGEQQVRSVSHLVTGAVEGLKEENISITDTNGNILFDKEMMANNSESSRLKLNQEQTVLTKAADERIQRNVQSMLDRVLGGGNAVVKVATELDFSPEEANEERYTPNGADANDKVIRSTRAVTEAGQGKTPGAPGGVPGTTSNIPSYQSQADNGEQAFDRQDVTTNYEVSKVIKKTTKSLGQIKRLSVSVAVNSVVGGEAITQEKLGDIKAMVVAASGAVLTVMPGASASRDIVTVASMKFDNSLLAKELEQMNEQQRQQFYMTLAGVVLAIVAIVALLIALRMAFGRRQDPYAPPSLSELDPVAPGLMNGHNGHSPDQAELLAAAQAEEDLRNSTEDVYALSGNGNGDAPEDLLQLTEAISRRTATVKGLSEMAKDDPANMARLLRAWMAE
ncbi:MAG: flagellar M-ring protein FliF [Candidatus Sericytochromatia bacterium]|nr:flagellar M-ring protein FliF [Candidatus Sericytochromatia bacterium]